MILCFYLAEKSDGMLLVITLIYFYENHHIEDSNGLWVFIGRFEPSNHKSNRVIKVDFVHHC